MNTRPSVDQLLRAPTTTSTTSTVRVDHRSNNNNGSFSSTETGRQQVDITGTAVNNKTSDIGHLKHEQNLKLLRRMEEVATVWLNHILHQQEQCQQLQEHQSDHSPNYSLSRDPHVVANVSSPSNDTPNISINGDHKYDDYCIRTLQCLLSEGGFKSYTTPSPEMYQRPVPDSCSMPHMVVTLKHWYTCLLSKCHYHMAVASLTGSTPIADDSFADATAAVYSVAFVESPATLHQYSEPSQSIEHTPLPLSALQHARNACSMPNSMATTTTSWQGFSTPARSGSSTTNRNQQSQHGSSVSPATWEAKTQVWLDMSSKLTTCDVPGQQQVRESSPSTPTPANVALWMQQVRSKQIIVGGPTFSPIPTTREATIEQPLASPEPCIPSPIKMSSGRSVVLSSCQEIEQLPIRNPEGQLCHQGENSCFTEFSKQATNTACTSPPRLKSPTDVTRIDHLVCDQSTTISVSQFTPAAISKSLQPSERDQEKMRAMIVSLYHARKCPHEPSNHDASSLCTVYRDCAMFKALWKHLCQFKGNCTKLPVTMTRETCPMFGSWCRRAGEALEHYNNCRQNTCTVCEPVTTWYIPQIKEGIATFKLHASLEHTEQHQQQLFCQRQGANAPQSNRNLLESDESEHAKVPATREKYQQQHAMLLQSEHSVENITGNELLESYVSSSSHLNLSPQVSSLLANYDSYDISIEMETDEFKDDNLYSPMTENTLSIPETNRPHFISVSSLGQHIERKHSLLPMKKRKLFEEV